METHIGWIIILLSILLLAGVQFYIIAQLKDDIKFYKDLKDLYNDLCKSGEEVRKAQEDLINCYKNREEQADEIIDKYKLLVKLLEDNRDNWRELYMKQKKNP